MPRWAIQDGSPKTLFQTKSLIVAKMNVKVAWNLHFTHHPSILVNSLHNPLNLAASPPAEVKSPLALAHSPAQQKAMTLMPI